MNEDSISNGMFRHYLSQLWSSAFTEETYILYETKPLLKSTCWWQSFSKSSLTFPLFITLLLTPPTLTCHLKLWTLQSKNRFLQGCPASAQELVLVEIRKNQAWHCLGEKWTSGVPEGAHLFWSEDDAITVQPSHLSCCRTLPWWGPCEADMAHVLSGNWAKASWFQWALDWTSAAKSCQAVQGQPQISENGQHTSPLANVSSENGVLVQADVKKVLGHWRRASDRSRAWWPGFFKTYLVERGSFRALKSFTYHVFPQYLMTLWLLRSLCSVASRPGRRRPTSCWTKDTVSSMLAVLFTVLQMWVAVSLSRSLFTSAWFFPELHHIQQL